MVFNFPPNISDQCVIFCRKSIPFIEIHRSPREISTRTTRIVLAAGQCSFFLAVVDHGLTKVLCSPVGAKVFQSFLITLEKKATCTIFC